MATFGQTGIGSGEAQSGGNLVRGSKFTLTEAAIITSISLYCRADTAGTVKVTMGIYLDSAGTPTTLQFVTAEISITNTTLAWNTATKSPGYSLPAGDYWIMWNNDTGTGGGGLWYGKSVLSGGEKADNETYPSFNNNFSVDATIDTEVSIYATYTAGTTTSTSTTTTSTSTSSSTSTTTTRSTSTTVTTTTTSTSSSTSTTTTRSTSTTTTSTSTSTTTTSTSTTTTSTSTTTTSTSSSTSTSTSTSSTTTWPYRFTIDGGGTVSAEFLTDEAGVTLTTEDLESLTTEDTTDPELTMVIEFR
jgi:hypothetical protein